MPTQETEVTVNEESLLEAEQADETLAAAEQAEEEAQKDVQIPITINGVTDETLFRTVLPKKGRRKNDTILWLFKPALDAVNPFANIAKMVGVTNFFKEVYDAVVKPACIHATECAFNAQTGKYEVIKFAEAFIDYFISAKRGGTGIRELQKKFTTMTLELEPYFAAQVNPDEAQQWDEEQMAKWKTLITEWVELRGKLAEIKQSGRGKRGKKAAIKTIESAEPVAA